MADTKQVEFLCRQELDESGDAGSVKRFDMERPDFREWGSSQFYDALQDVCGVVRNGKMSAR
jgi:hypothetical protein